MKISGRVDGSVRGAILSKQTSTNLGASLKRGNLYQRDSKHGQSSTHPRQHSEAASCPRTSAWLFSTFFTAQKRTIATTETSPKRNLARYSSSAAVATKAFRHQEAYIPPVQQRDKNELLSYVKSDTTSTTEEHLEFYKDPYRRGYAQADVQQLRVSEQSQDIQYPSNDEVVPVRDGLQDQLHQLYGFISRRLRQPHRTSLESIYDLYKQLPEPRMLHIPWQWRNRLLRLMGTPSKRDMESMLRYFSLVSDVKNAGMTLRRTQWNNALAFAARYMAQTTTQDLESVLKLWREMEHESKIEGNDVTFNILFDVAAKAGNFALAEMIYQEMENRGIEFNRYHHVSLIHYFGLRLDSGGIRAAYREMVESGEMIDTVVLNCVLSGLLRCGEEPAAEETYERMKQGHIYASDMPHRNYMMDKVVTKVLMMFTKIAKQHPMMVPGFQQNVNLTPNLHTYRLLIDHYAIKVGDLSKVAKYLDEMKHLNISVSPVIFLGIFKGFFSHGGFSDSEWSEQRLHGVIAALYQAKDEQITGFRIDKWLVVWALRAVNKCSTKQVLRNTFDELSRKWVIPPDKIPFMNGLLDNIVRDKDMNSSRGDWEGPRYERRKKGGLRL